MSYRRTNQSIASDPILGVFVTMLILVLTCTLCWQLIRPKTGEWRATFVHVETGREATFRGSIYLLERFGCPAKLTKLSHYSGIGTMRRAVYVTTHEIIPSTCQTRKLDEPF